MAQWRSRKKYQGAFTTASMFVYYGSFSRAYFEKIRIVLPMAWDIQGYQDRKTGYSNLYDSDIVIENEISSLYGHMPYVDQLRTCHAEGDTINFPLSFFKNLEDTEHRIGNIGTFIVKQWMGYRYGVFEEAGFTMDPTYPSVICGQDGKLTAVSCTDEPLNPNGFMSIRGDERDCDCSKGATLPYCMYKVNANDNEDVLSSIMGFSQLTSNTVFCYPDGGFLHEEDQPNLHNNICDNSSTFDTILDSTDFRNGHNGEVFLDDTTPNFEVVQQSLIARIILDTKQEVALGSHVKPVLHKWILGEKMKGVDLGSDIVASGGKYWRSERIPFDQIEKIETNKFGAYNNLQNATDLAKEGLTPDYKIPSYIILVSDGNETDGHLEDSFDGNGEFILIAIDTSQDGNDVMLRAASKSHGFYVHTGPDVLKIVEALETFTSTYSYNPHSNEKMFSGDFASPVTVPIDTSLQKISFSYFLNSPTFPETCTITTKKNGKSSSHKPKYITETYIYNIQEGEFGDWEFSITCDGSPSLSAQILVSAEAKKDEKQKTLECEIRQNLIDREPMGARIVGKALHGENPIVKAKLEAIVGDQTIPMELVDGEQGSILGDGVYTATLPGNAQGSVKCKLVAKKGETFPHPGFENAYTNVKPSELRQPFCCGSLAPEPEDPPVFTENFVRHAQSAFIKL